MATRTSQTTEGTLGVGPNEGSAQQGLKYETIHYSSIGLGDTDTPGSKSIVRAAFEGDSTSDIVQVDVRTDLETIEFYCDAGTFSGTVHLWSRGY